MAGKPTTTRMALLLRLIDEGYEVKTWHGPNLRGSLRGITALQAAGRPAPGRHNIWEIAVHAAYWKYIVRRRITGEKRGSFPLAGSNWIRRPAPGADWKSDLRMLDDIHHSMRRAVASLKDADLGKRPPGSKVSNAAIIMGIAAHDIYHAGQVQLLKRLTRR
ncbi:MAG TPA: DinB family protein [Bacteroidota bacterium]|nr:DinB family protein [Bacteroidota bacterium]